MDQILQCGFTYDKEDSGKVICSVCQDRGEFIYPQENGLTFKDNIFLPRPFCNLKKSLVRHISDSKCHANFIRDKKEQDQLELSIKSLNYQAGMNLGRICMKNFILGRPYMDYESDVLMLKLSGAEVGELNHSRKFPPAFRKHVFEVVHKRVTQYLQTPLIQTGFLPSIFVMPYNHAWWK